MSAEFTKRDLLDTLPRYYDDSPEVDAIMEANAGQVANTRKSAREVTDQFYVRTATKDGLSAWERVLDLPPRPNSSLAFRRNRILARLNGTAPATVSYLTDVVNAHVADKSARIIEVNGEYRFEAEVDVRQMSDITPIYNDINDVKPAHLAFGVTGLISENLRLRGKQYAFGVTYLICNMFNTSGNTALLSSGVAMGGKSNANAVRYPRAGATVASNNTNAASSAMFSGEIMPNASDNSVIYPRAGATITGEGLA
ncbi:putative phage tail protein [Sporosarcina sp. SAFN-015]|uniref:putative phage tail protein n=1 Tax=Sporosarcina sp. SAFN-015 TaxID=3387274 RepID=UPI003F7F0C91